MRLTIFRNGFLRELPVVVGGRENAAWVIRRVERPTEAQKRVYEGWLWNAWPRK